MRYAKFINGRVTEIFDDEYTEVPEGCEALSPEDAEAMKNHPLGFSVFRKDGANCVPDASLIAEAEAGKPLNQEELADALAEIMESVTIENPGPAVRKLQARAARRALQNSADNQAS